MEKVANRVGRGQRARTFARMFVAAYLGYSVPVLALGIIAAHATFGAGFITIVTGLALVTALLPFLREAPAPVACSRVVASAT